MKNLRRLAKSELRTNRTQEVHAQLLSERVGLRPACAQLPFIEAYYCQERIGILEVGKEDSYVIDLNRVHSQMLFEEGEAYPQGLADAAVPRDMHGGAKDRREIAGRCRRTEEFVTKQGITKLWKMHGGKLCTGFIFPVVAV